MEEMREHLDPVDHARPGTREMAAGIDGEDVAGLRRRQLAPLRVGEQLTGLLRGALEVSAARRDDEDLGRPLAHCVPAHADGISALPAETVEPAGKLDHLRYPVPAAEQGIDPLEEEDASSSRAAELDREPRQPLLVGLDERSSNLVPPSRTGE